MYRGPKHYFPGDSFNYNFDDCEVHQLKKEALNKELTLKKDNITRSLKKPFQKKHVTMKANLLLYLRYFKECKFQGYNIKPHLESKAHLLSSETAKLQQSYLTPQVNFLTKVSKVKQNAPVLRSQCHLFSDRIDFHLHNQHQIRRKTNQLEQQISKSRILTQHFMDEFNRKKETDSVDSERSNEKSEITAANCSPNPNSQNLHKTKLTSEKQRQEKQDIKKMGNSKEKKQEERAIGKMGPSTSSEIRLRGKYEEASPDEIQHMSLFQNKLPLTKAKKKYSG